MIRSRLGRVRRPSFPVILGALLLLLCAGIVFWIAYSASRGQQTSETNADKINTNSVKIGTVNKRTDAASSKANRALRLQALTVKCLNRPTPQKVGRCLGALPGAPGRSGAPGLPGSPGPVGKVGGTGLPGLRGLRGEKGDPGTPGNPGSPGPACNLPECKGPVGADGQVGKDGSDGKDGGEGAQGVQGPQGDPGAQGPQGAQGAPGANGADGTNATAVGCTVDPVTFVVTACP